MTGEKLGILQTRLDEILEQRDALFPKRDAQNTAAMERATVEYINALREEPQAEWKPDEQLVSAGKDLVDAGFFLCGYRKSGTTLLLNLLNGHADLITLPGDTRALNLIEDREQFTARYRDLTTNSNYHDLNRDLDTYFAGRMINPTGQKPFWILGESGREYAAFLHYFDYWLKSYYRDPRAPFLAFALAYTCANHRRPARPRYWVEKTPNNEQHIASLLEYFPHAKFIHIVREPGPNLAPIRRLNEFRGWPWDLEAVCRDLDRSMSRVSETKNSWGKEGTTCCVTRI